MIYNWSPIGKAIENTQVSVDEVRRVVAEVATTELVDPHARVSSDVSYFKVLIGDTYLRDPRTKKYTAPTPGDVAVVLDDLYGIVKILSSTKKGGNWTFEILISKLVKEVYAPTKEFARAAS